MFIYPCPVCESDKTVCLPSAEDGTYCVFCNTCGAHGIPLDSEDGAIIYWNGKTKESVEEDTKSLGKMPRFNCNHGKEK